MIFVIFYHSCKFWGGHWFSPYTPLIENQYIDDVGGWFNTFQLPAFVLISGYIYEYLRHERGLYNDYWLFLTNKIKRLLVPCLTVTIVWLIPMSIFLRDYTAKDCVDKFVVSGGGDQLWFLSMLFWVFAIYRLIEIYVRKHTWIAVPVFTLSYLLGTLLLIKTSFCVFQIPRSFQYLPYFYIGCCFRKNHRENGVPQWWSCRSIIYTLVIVHIAIYMVSINYNSSQLFFNTILSFSGGVISFVALTSIGYKITEIKNNGFINKLQSNNFAMYLYHQQIIYITIITFNGHINPLWNVFLNFCIASAVSYCIASYINRYTVLRKIHGIK